MPAFTSILLGLGAAASLAGTGVNVANSISARKSAEDAAAQQEVATNKVLTEQENSRQQAMNDKNRIAQEAYAKQKLASSLGQQANKGGTVLTKGLGAPSAYGTGGLPTKTLLGL